MAGNVSEWVSDRFAVDYDERAPSVDPHGTGPSSGAARVVRGGSYHGNSEDVRVSVRGWEAPYTRFYGLGFRCARDG